MSMILRDAALQSVHESWVVPPGLEAFFLLSPALKRWATLVRPYGAGSSYISFSISFHWVTQERVLVHIRQRCDDTLVFSDDSCCCGQAVA